MRVLRTESLLGSMLGLAALVVLMLWLMLWLWACHRAPSPSPSQVRQPLPVVEVLKLAPRDVERSFEWLATLDGSTNAEIRPRVDGYIESVNYQEGAFIEKGALLFRLDQRPLRAAVRKAQGEHEQAQAQLDKARADVARYTPLVAERALSKEELDNARAAVEVARANVLATQGTLQIAALKLDWASVRSPISGIAGIAQVRVGNLVDPNQVLTTISTVDPIRASFHISEREYLNHAEMLNRINDAAYASRRYLELILSNGRVHPDRARRIIVNRMLDPTTGTLLIQALFPNPGNLLRPGLFARVRVHTGTYVNVLVVPELAVQALQGLFRVAVVDSSDRVEVRPVRLGAAVDSGRMVEGGLHAGERVIVQGWQNVQPGARVDAEPAARVGTADGGS
jgi:membrane fusion protein (multidrug efflux system)